MAAEWMLDFLAVSRHEEPPSDAVFTRALGGAGLGTVVYTPAPPDDPGASATAAGRQRLGSYALSEPAGRATARLTVARHTHPALAGMAEAAFTGLTHGLGAQDIATLREGRLAFNLRVNVTDGTDAQFIKWATKILLMVLGIGDGAAIDPAAQRSYGRGELAALAGAASPAAHVAFHTEAWGADALWLHTHGLQKFARPELDLADVPQVFAPEARALLTDVAERLIQGDALRAGQEIDLDDMGQLVAIAMPADVDHQAPFGRLRLVDEPLPGAEMGAAATSLLERIVLGQSRRSAATGDVPGALATVERVLAANPDDCAAMAYKAELTLAGGDAMEALAIGELMGVRAPGDWRGALTMGRALAALGRAPEAERAYTRAIERNPEDAAAYLARATVRAQMGNTQAAEADQARAAYLSE